MNWDEWGGDVLSPQAQNARLEQARLKEVPIRKGLVVEVVDGFVGEIVGFEQGNIVLEDRKRKRRLFPLGGGYLIEGVPVVLVKPAPKQAAAARTASGSRATTNDRARIAAASRIFVEGLHDAELVEKVWGHDLRAEGVVVEPLHGVDDLPSIVAEFAPERSSRLGILVDHLVPGSKESRIAEAVARGPHGANVLVVGHPYVDIWQSVKPSRLGLQEWPTIPRSIEWKRGILQHLGWPSAEQADIADGWKRILARVRDWNDLEPALLGRVEQLIDFVTEPVE